MKKHSKNKDKVKYMTVFNITCQDIAERDALEKLLNEGYEPFAFYPKPVKSSALQPNQYEIKEYMWLKQKVKVAAIAAPEIKPDPALGSDVKSHALVENHEKNN